MQRNLWSLLIWRFKPNPKHLPKPLKKKKNPQAGGSGQLTGLQGNQPFTKSTIVICEFRHTSDHATGPVTVACLWLSHILSEPRMSEMQRLISFQFGQPSSGRAINITLNSTSIKTIYFFLPLFQFMSLLSFYKWLSFIRKRIQITFSSISLFLLIYQNVLTVVFTLHLIPKLCMKGKAEKGGKLNDTPKRRKTISIFICPLHLWST